MNDQIRNECPSPSAPPTLRCKCKVDRDKDLLETLARSISAKIKERNLRGAACLACSEELSAEDFIGTFAALRAKRPHLHENSAIAPLEGRSENY